MAAVSLFWDTNMADVTSCENTLYRSEKWLVISMGFLCSFLKLQIMIYIFYQGHPTTVFCKISVRRSKCYLEFSITWGRLIFKMTVPLTHNFRSLSYKFPTIFWSLIIHISLPRLGYFSSRKGNLKCSDLKIWWREKSGKFSLWFRDALNSL